MIWHDVNQNSEEWDELRRGKFTASSFTDLIMAKTTAGYKKAIRKVVYERLTGESPESFKSDYMERGHDIEPLAAEQYEINTFNTVSEGGFFEFDEWIGCSPDRLVGDDGLVEIKSPAYNTFIDYLISGKVPTEYIAQVQGQLYVTGRKWCDFVAYHPSLPIMIIRVFPDPVFIEQLKINIAVAISEAQTIITKIKSL